MVNKSLITQVILLTSVVLTVGLMITPDADQANPSVKVGQSHKGRKNSG